MAKGTTCWSVDGVHLSKGSDTNENRGFNQEGYACNVTANTANINRQLVSDGHYSTTDGEGILHQASSGNDAFRNVWHANDFSSGTSGPVFYYKLFNVEDCEITVSHLCCVHQKYATISSIYLSWMSYGH